MVEKGQQFKKTEIEPQEKWGFGELQKRVREIYQEHDAQCDYGPDTILAKLMGNVVTLTHALRKTPNDFETINRSLANVFIWTSTLANVSNINIAQIMEEKFGEGCPHCKQMPCFLAQGKNAKPLLK